MVAQMLNIGPNSQSAHLAVTHKQQPDAVNDLQHLVNRRQVERIIGVVAGYDLRNQRQSQWIQRRRHDFDLAQTRVVFAVPELKHAFLCASVVTRNRRRIQAHPFRRQFVHPQNGASQVRLDRLPGANHTQALQQDRQAIISEIQLAQFAQPGNPSNCLARLPHPGLHGQFAMIAFRQNMRQPNRRNPTPTTEVEQEAYWRVQQAEIVSPTVHASTYRTQPRL